MPERLRVLVVEDSPDDAELLSRELRRSGYDVTSERVETADGMETALDGQTWDLVIADYALPQFSAPAALAVLKRRDLDLPFIIVSGTIGEETAVAAMKAGAHDYFMKGNLARLVPAIQRELREAEDRRQRSRAEAALVRQREYTRLLVESGNALIVGLDLDGRVTVFNPAAESLTGYRREDVRGKSWFDLMLPRDQAARAWKEFEKLKTTGVPEDFENPIVTARGDERIVTWRNVVLRDQGRVAGVLAFGMDVTERRRAEQERRAMEQVARRAEKLAALGTLAAGLAHELNNPIGIISSRIELMLLEAETAGLPATLVEDLRVLHRQAQRVARIASGLLSFARQSSGERMPVDLNHVVEETLLLAERQMLKQGIRVDAKLDPGLPPLLGDANTLQQVLLNLITNAWDALDSGGHLRIETSATPGPPATVRLVVTDTGPGIDPDVLPRIFDPFFSTKPRGTGLGLSITDGIVREHGGTIDVESAPGEGTRFVLTFPAVAAAPSAQGAAQG
jgi:PAS domain S-box-containing protein